MHCDSSLPLVSVLMPVYNAGDFLRPAILSILNQTYSNIELIIIDDGSTDNAIVENKDIVHSNKKIRFVPQDNSGRPMALNRGLEMMQGEFWIIEDADDVSHPRRVEKQLATLLANSELAAVFCKNDIILPDGRIFAPGCQALDPAQCKALIDQGKVPAHDATGMYRSKMTETFRFDKEMWLIEGVDFVIRIGEKYPVSVIADCLYSHRVNYESITHTRADKISEAVEKFKYKMSLRRGERTVAVKKRLGKNGINVFRHRRYDTILPYAMVSIVEQRRSGNWQVAINTALVCIQLHPLDPLYYKPFVYCFIPVAIIDYYREKKKNLSMFWKK